MVLDNLGINGARYGTALAWNEAAWTQEKSKNYDQFLTRLKVHLPYMKKRGVYYFNPFDKAGGDGGQVWKGQSGLTKHEAS